MADPVTVDETPDRASPLERFIVLAWTAPCGLMSGLLRRGPLASGARRLLDEVDMQVRADRERAAERRAAREQTPPRAMKSDQAGAATDPATLAENGTDAPVLVSELALPDYDHLPASQIVAMLGDLGPGELDDIDGYERANRHRRTVLGKLDQLGR